MTIETLNNLPKEKAFQQLFNCCGSNNWVKQLLEHRPFKNEEALYQLAENCWYQKTNTSDWLEAFTHHPKIGDIKSLEKKFATTKHWAGLQLLQKRLPNDKDTELKIAMGEQHKITNIRIAKLLKTDKKMSHITTHVLDTSLGKPGQGILIKLQEPTADGWKTLGKGTTNSDGRVADLLASDVILSPGTYRMWFDTGSYFNKQKIKSFYPEVGIQFTVFDDSHYHVPLLLNPYGYSTYRGS